MSKLTILAAVPWTTGNEADIATPDEGFVTPFFDESGALKVKRSNGQIEVAGGGGSGGDTPLYKLPENATLGSLIVFGQLDGGLGWFPFAAPSDVVRRMLTCEDGEYEWTEVRQGSEGDPNQLELPIPPGRGEYELKAINGVVEWVAKEQPEGPAEVAKLEGVFTASDVFAGEDGRWDLAHATDGDVSTAFSSATVNGWIQIRTALHATKQLVKVRVYPYTASYGSMQYSSGLVVEGSSDGVSWQTLGSGGNAVSGEWLEIDAVAPESMQYYRVRNPGDYLTVNEVEFFGK